ncbi:MAG: FkbM family methyltransferase [Albidovulum sp.]
MKPIAEYPRYAPRRPGRTASVIVQLLLRALDQARGGQVACVQVGANDGAMADPVLGFFTNRPWRGLLIEPHPAYFADLVKRHASRPHITCLNIGVSDVPGSMKLHFLAEAARGRYPRWIRGCASLDRARMEEQLAAAVTDFGAKPEADDLEAVDIRLERLDQILAAQDVTRADLLVIDVEGHEAAVLASVDLGALDLSLVICECNNDVTATEPVIADRLSACGMTVFRVGAEIIAIRPERLSIPMEDMLTWIGVQSLGSAATTLEPLTEVSHHAKS